MKDQLIESPKGYLGYTLTINRKLSSQDRYPRECVVISTRKILADEVEISIEISKITEKRTTNVNTTIHLPKEVAKRFIEAMGKTYMEQIDA